jgi:hypothetical protein
MQTKSLRIGVNNFFLNSKNVVPGLNQRPLSDLCKEIRDNLDKVKPGYRDGVLLVPVSPLHLKTRVLPLFPTLHLISKYEARVPGEKPRMCTRAVVTELPEAKSASAVIYRADVLRERNEQSTEADWELISVLAHATEEAEPMPVGTLLANHFGADGGTDTKMSSEQFEAALRESYQFWQNHVMAIEEREL